MTTRTTRRFDFAGSQGHQLSGALELPAGKVQAVAIFAHCFTCSKDVFAASHVARVLADHGLAVLRFDFTGLGNSDGDFANTGFTSNIEDLQAAAEALRDEIGAPSILIGHSLGGAAVLAATQRIDGIKAVATINAPASPAHVKHLLKQSEDEIREAGEAEVEIAGRPFTIKRAFLQDIEAAQLNIADLSAALLVLHAPDDSIVSIDNAQDIFAAAPWPKSLIALDGADHLLSRRRDARHAARLIATWLGPIIAAEAPAPKALTEHGAVRVTETRIGKFTALVEAGHHTLPADEPEDVEGGTDTGPAPFDYLLSGLGACTTMTLRMYADFKKLALGPVSVDLRIDQLPAEDVPEAAGRTGKVPVITREITPPPGTSPELAAKLVEIADKCPVHRTLTAPPVIRTRLKGD